MALKLRLKKERIKINYRKDNSDKDSPILASFYVEPLTSSELNDLFNECMKTEWLSPNKKTPKELHREPDFALVFRKRFLKEIVDWEGIEDPETGKSIKCTKENIILVWDYHNDIINWVMEQVDEIKETKEEDKKKKIKN